MSALSGIIAADYVMPEAISVVDFLAIAWVWESMALSGIFVIRCLMSSVEVWEHVTASVSSSDDFVRVVSIVSGE